MNPYKFRANGVQAVNLSIKADYVYFRSATLSGGAVDDTIILQSAGGGESMVLLPGQGCPFDHNVRDWVIYNASGVGTVDGMLLFGKGPFTDNRPSGQTSIVGTVNITGDVNVIDNNKARTLAGDAFMASEAVTAVAAQYAYAQLWNPPGSGKNLTVEKVVGSSAAGGSVGLYVANAALATASASIPITKRPGNRASIAQQKRTNDVGNPAGVSAVMDSRSIPANSFTIFELSKPIVLAPGYGCVVSAGLPNQDIRASFEFTEDPL